MQIKPQHHHAAVRFGGLAFCLILLWAWFRPIGYAWSEHAGWAFDAILTLVSVVFVVIQLWRYQQDLQGDGHE